MRLLTLFLFITLSLSFAQAAQPLKPVKPVIGIAPAVNKKVKPAPLRTDNSVVQVKQFDKEKLARYKQRAEFQYNEKEVGPSLWTRFWRWVWHLFDDLQLKPGNDALSHFFIFLKYLFIALGIAAILFIILRVAGVDIGGLFKRKPADASVPYSETLENIHEINFDTDIEAAIARHNYRLAVRLLYLKSLKQLSDAGLIHWQIDKTNTAYIDELTNADQREAFTVLTRQFEFIWYGEFTINGPAFQNIKTLFTNFKQTLA